MASANTNDPAEVDAQWLRKALSESNEYAVIRLSREGLVEGWHGASERLFGYRADEVVGRSFEMLFIEADRARALPQLELEVASGAGRSEDDRWHRRKDGSSFWASGALTPQRDEHGAVQGFAKLLRDRTDLHIRFQTLVNQVEALEDALESHRGNHLTLVHELRNSLGALGQAAAALHLQMDADGAPRKLLDVALRQARVMRRLLEEATAPHAGVTEDMPRCEPVLLQDALRLATQSIEPACRAKSLHLQLFMPDVPVRLPADPEHLQRMLLNLLTNAVKYTPPGGHIDVTATVEGDYVALRFSDDGVGIAAEHIERIFELFTREPDAAARGAEGFGIGLAVVKRLATLHGGFVEVRSAGKGKGSQFSLQLPLGDGNGASLPAGAAPQEPNPH